MRCVAQSFTDQRLTDQTVVLRRLSRVMPDCSYYHLSMLEVQISSSFNYYFLILFF